MLYPKIRVIGMPFFSNSVADWTFITNQMIRQHTEVESIVGKANNPIIRDHVKYALVIIRRHP